MSNDPWNDPETKAWAQHALDTLVPMLEDSAITVSLVPKGQADIKYAVELGLSIMMNKPIFAVVEPGTQVPPKLAKVADRIIEADISTEAGARELSRKIGEILKEWPA